MPLDSLHSTQSHSALPTFENPECGAQASRGINCLGAWVNFSLKGWDVAINYIILIKSQHL